MSIPIVPHLPELPPNLDIATAFDLGTLPFSYTEDANTVAAATAPVYELWFKYTHTDPRVAAIAVSFLAPESSNYDPGVSVYEGIAQATGNFYFLAYGGVTNVPLQVPVKAGNTYYFAVDNSFSPGPLDAPLTITGAAPPREDAVVGAILINDDTFFPDYAAGAQDGRAQGFPLAVISQTDGRVLQLRKAPGRNEWPGGEAFGLLPNGVSCWQDALLGYGVFSLYGPLPAAVGDDPAVIATLTLPPPHVRIPTLVTNAHDAFYIGYPGGEEGNSVVHRVSAGGAIERTWTLATAQLWAMGVSPDETILYYCDRNPDTADSGEPIQRWDLVNDVALADFQAGRTGKFFTRDLLVLADGSIIVGYVNNTYAHLVRFGANGSIIWELDDTGLGNLIHGAGDRMSRGADPDSFIIFTNLAAKTWLITVRILDGLVLGTVMDPPQFEQGIYAGLPGDVLDQSFGNSNSCAVYILSALPPVTECPDRPTIIDDVAPGPPAPLVVTPPAVATITTDSADPVAVAFSATVSGGTGPFVVTFDPPSGSLFPLGDTLVTVTVTDVGG